MGRKYRFVLVVTTGYAAFRASRLGDSEEKSTAPNNKIKGPTHLRGVCSLNDRILA
jgi:hypothetical protein